jgi:FkbM family methyltransferase
MMTAKRFLLALRSLHRFTEIISCMKSSKNWLPETFAFLQTTNLQYPYNLTLRSGHAFTLENWEDITTAWVVLYGNEYSVSIEDQVIIDAGANIGIFSTLCLLRNPAAKVIAIEPFPETYSRLLNTIEANNVAGSVSAVKAALVGRSRNVWMNYDKATPSHSRKTDAPVGTGISIPGITLDEVLRQFELNTIDYLKIDIEGAESDVFENSSSESLLAAKKIGVEYHSARCKDAVFRRAESLGFRIARHPKQGTAGVVEFERTQ